MTWFIINSIPLAMYYSCINKFFVRLNSVHINYPLCTAVGYTSSGVKRTSISQSSLTISKSIGATELPSSGAALQSSSVATLVVVVTTVIVVASSAACVIVIILIVLRRKRRSQTSLFNTEAKSTSNLTDIDNPMYLGMLHCVIVKT